MHVDRNGNKVGAWESSKGPQLGEGSPTRLGRCTEATAMQRWGPPCINRDWERNHYLYSTCPKGTVRYSLWVQQRIYCSSCRELHCNVSNIHLPQFSCYSFPRIHCDPAEEIIGQEGTPFGAQQKVHCKKAIADRTMWTNALNQHGGTL